MGVLELLSPAHLSPKVWTSRLSQSCQVAPFVFLLTQEESSTLVGPWKCRPLLVAKVVLGCLTVIVLEIRIQSVTSSLTTRLTLFRDSQFLFGI